MNSTPELVVDKEKIKKAIQSGLPLTITTYSHPKGIEIYIEQVIDAFLQQMNQMKIKDYIVYCVQELIINAKKANTKRIYFKERGLDINNDNDYIQGMKNFKEDTISNIDYYLKLQEENGLYVKVFLQAKKNIINIEVHNNVAANKIEQMRIKDKMAKYRRYDNLEDALSQVLDDSEGAGLGLVILILMLKKMGLGDDAFSIKTKDNCTIAGISIPLNQTAARQYHHDPDSASYDRKDMVNTVYPVNMFCEYESKNANFDKFDSNPPENYGLQDRKQVDTLLERFSTGFIREGQL